MGEVSKWDKRVGKLRGQTPKTLGFFVIFDFNLAVAAVVALKRRGRRKHGDFRGGGDMTAGVQPRHLYICVCSFRLWEKKNYARIFCQGNDLY